MIRIGILGQPNAGKSTLFNLLCGTTVPTADYPFTTVEPNKGTYKAYDEKVATLAASIAAPDILWSEVELWDIAGLIENASEGEGLGNEFLGQIKDCDALIHVVAAYDGQGKATIEKSMALINKEIALFDHKLLLKPFEKARRLRKLYPKETSYATQDAVFTRAYYGTKDGVRAEDVLRPEELSVVHDVGLISSKPQLIVLNGRSAAGIVLPSAISADIAELAEIKPLSEAERQVLGFAPNAVEQFFSDVTSRILSILEMKSFYTVGELGVGRWIVPKDASALECAQHMHNDFSASIKTVDVATYNNFLQKGSWHQLTQAGQVRKYGPSYVPIDGEVLYFNLMT